MDASHPIESSRSEDLVAYLRRVERLNDLGREINFAASEAALYRLVARYTPEIVPSDRASVALLSADREHFQVLSLEGESGALPQGALVPLAGTGVGAAVTERSVQSSADMQAGPFVDWILLGKRGLRSVVCTPLVARGEVLGTLNVAAMVPGAYSERDHKLLAHIAAHLAANLEARRLFASTEQALRETERLVDELRRIEAFKTQILHIAAHDLRSPLSGIMMAAEALVEESLPADEHRDLLTRIASETRGLLETLSRLLDSEQLAAGALRVHRARMRIGDLVEALVDRWRLTSKGKSVSLVAIGDLDAEVDSDTELLRHVLDNLVSNAIKFSPVGELVTVEVKAGSSVAVQVHDRGCGVDEDDRARIFERFATARARPTAGESSSGLGLFIVARIARALDCEVRHEHRPGGGSSFVVEIPHWSEPAPAP